ncbi:MAG: DUF456 domain-containing protein [Bacteroidales bacterium]|nr:DUF456 domain-containing protein [Bacteroidales bacterium]
MDLIWILIGSVLLIIGIIFSILPVIPGQIVSWFTLLILQLTSNPPFTTNFLTLMALITAAITFLDYVVPIWGTKKLGGSRNGVWGATIGLILGIPFFPPLGLIIGSFVGAFVGELIAGKDTNTALKSGFGSFLGFLAGTLMKLGISIFIGYHFVVSSIDLLKS